MLATDSQQMLDYELTGRQNNSSLQQTPIRDLIGVLFSGLDFTDSKSIFKAF